jgi:heat shock protein beta
LHALLHALHLPSPPAPAAHAPARPPCEADDGDEGDEEDGDEELGDDDSEEDELAAPPKKMKKIKRDDWEKLNDNKAIWLRKPSEVTKEEYEKFYTAISKVGSGARVGLAEGRHPGLP